MVSAALFPTHDDPAWRRFDIDARRQFFLRCCSWDLTPSIAPTRLSYCAETAPLHRGTEVPRAEPRSFTIQLGLRPQILPVAMVPPSVWRRIAVSFRSAPRYRSVLTPPFRDDRSTSPPCARTGQLLGPIASLARPAACKAGDTHAGVTHKALVRRILVTTVFPVGKAASAATPPAGADTRTSPSGVLPAESLVG